MINFESEIQTLINNNLGYLRSVALRIVNSSADADDAVQMALVKAWQKQKSYRGECTFSAWVGKIVISSSYDILRKKMRENRKIEQYIQDDSENSDYLRQLDLAVANLPELYRDTIHLAVYSGLSIKEAALELGCSENTLYQRIYRAKELIKASWSQYEDR